MCKIALMFSSLKSKLFVSFNFRTFGMACHFEEERFSLGEKSECMVTVTPFMGKLKVHIREFYINGNGEIKPGKSGIVLEIKEFDKLVELIPQIKESIERYELKDTVIPSSPFQLDLPVLDLDTVFYHLHQHKNLLQSLKTRNFSTVNPNILHYHNHLPCLMHPHS